MKRRQYFFFTLLIPLLFSSCLADILNEKFNFSVPVVITYKSEKGTTPSLKRVNTGTLLTQEDLPSLTEAGYDFGGWFLDNNFTITAAADIQVDKDITLYAKWIARNDTPYKIMNYFLDVTNGSTTFVYRSDKDQNLLGTTDRNFTEFDYNLNFDSSDSQMSDFFLIGNDILNENMNSNIIKGDGTSVFHCYYYKGRLDASYFEALVNALPNIAVQYSVQFTQANLLNTPSLYDICWVLFQKSSNYSSSYNSSGNNELLYKPTFHLDLTDTTITSIQPNTAFNCHALRSISIPRTVTYISRNAFKDCNFLELVWLSSENNKRWYYKDNAYNEYPIETPMLPETIARMLKNDGYELTQH